MRLVIGLVGKNGAGKSTYAKSLTELMGTETCAIIKSSDILIETLNLWGIPCTRMNLQKLSEVMEEIQSGVLTSAVKQRIEAQKADVIVFDGVRWITDEQLIRSYPRNLLIYVTASAEIRYQRLRNRNEKIGETNLSRENFFQEEQMATEVKITEIGNRADITIINEGPKELLQSSINSFYQQITAALRK